MMHRSIRCLLGLAAATAAIALAAPAAASAASARHHNTPPQGEEGLYYSKEFKGSWAHVQDVKTYVDRNGRLVVGGKLYDQGSPARLCGYVQIRFEDFEPEDRDSQIYSAKHCGKGFKQFRFAEFGAGTAGIRVCYTDAYRGKHLCGKWKNIYESE